MKWIKRIEQNHSHKKKKNSVMVELNFELNIYSVFLYSG